MTCSCQKPAETNVPAAVPEAVVATQTEILAKQTEVAILREPLIGIAESTYAVRGCGTCEMTEGGSPKSIRIECLNASGAYESLHEVKLPRKLSKAYEGRKNMVCMPWVRVQRDPAKFRECLDRAQRIGPMSDAKAVFKFVGEYLAAQDQEVFLSIMLDTQLQVRGVSEIVRGARDGVQVPIPDTLRVVLVEGAMSFIVVHNHPSGQVVPSEADKELTKSLAHAAKTVRVPLMDHVIVGANKYYSFAEHHLI